MKELMPLAVAFVVLAGLVGWRESTRGSTRSLSEEAALKALQTREFTPDDVAKIEVTGPGASTPAYTLSRQDKSWRATSTFTAPASGASVSKLLDTLAKAEGEFRSDDQAALDEFELTPAKAVDVRVLDKDGKDLVHLALGRGSGQRGAFVRNLADNADASKAYALTADLRGLLGLGRAGDKPEAGFFHEKEFPQFKLDSASHAELAAPGRRAEFERPAKDAKGKPADWKVAKGGPDAPLKKDGLEKAIASLSGGLHPTSLVDPAKKKELGFDAPAYRIAVTSEDGTTRTAIGASDAAGEHFYVRLDVAQDPEVLYEASDYEFHQMFPTGSVLFDLKLPDVADADLGEIDVISFKGGSGHSIHVSRTGTKPQDDWKLTQPGFPFTAKQTVLRGIAGALKSLHPVDYVDPGIDAGKAFVAMRWGAPGSTAGGDQHSLTIGDKSPQGKDRLLMVFPAKHAWVLQDSTVDRLAPELLSLLEPKVLHGWTADDVKSVRVESASPDWTPQYSLARDGDGWMLVRGDAKSPADGKAVGDWIAKLLTLEVKTLRDGEDGAAIEARVWLDNAKGQPVALLVLPLDKDQRWIRADSVEFSVPEKDFVPAAASFEPKPPAPTQETPKDDGKK